MIIAPYQTGQLYDPLFKRIVGDVSYKLNNKKDDFLILCVGTTGTGKSALGLHAEELYMGNEASVSYIGLDKGSFAEALHKSKTKQLPRFCMNDEANISKRDALSKYNKDVYDTYMSIRGLRIFHWWNNPSADMIDKPFIEERIKGLILITTKDHDRPRIYYYFRKRDLLKVWEKYKELKLPLLNKIKKEYAYYRGWFKDYNGSLLEEYNKKKDARMDFKVDDFRKKYGIKKEELKIGAVAEAVGVEPNTIREYTKTLEKKGIITEDLMHRNIAGMRYYKPECIKIFKQHAEEKHGKKNE